MTTSTRTDVSVRSYILALQAGQRPARPDCGPFWSPLVDILEDLAFNPKFKGKPQSIAAAFTGVAAGNPALDDLLHSSDQQQEETILIAPNAMLALPEFAYLPKDLSRGACTWLDQYEAFSLLASPEGYDHFHVFCGLWLLSTVAARRVYIAKGQGKVYPNLMFSLFSKTSTSAKSTTAEVAVNILKKTGLGYHLTPKRISPQRLMSEMAGTILPTNYGDLDALQRERIRQRLAMAGQKAMFSDEFGKFIRSILRKQSTNTEFQSLLLEMDSCPDDFDSSTFSRGGENIEAPYLSMLGCMTPPDLTENSKSGADFWADGFWARFGFVAAPVGSDKDETLDLEELPIPLTLISPLIDWHQRLGLPECSITELPGKDPDQPSGKFVISRGSLPEIKATIDQESKDAYKRYRTALKQLFKTYKHEDFNGSYARLPEMAVRIALLLASLENDNHVEIRHWARAQELTELLRASLHEMYTQVNAPTEPESSPASLIEDDILRILTKKGPLTLNVLRTSYLKKRSVDQLERALRQMDRAGMIQSFPTHGSTKYKIKKIIEEDRDDGTDDEFN